MITSRLSRPLLLAAAVAAVWVAASRTPTEGDVGRLLNGVANLADPPRDDIRKASRGRYRAEKDRERMAAAAAVAAGATISAGDAIAALAGLR